MSSRQNEQKAHRKTLIIIPAYNEERSIGYVIQEIQMAINADILVVNDSSLDETLDIVKEYGVNYLDLCENLGIGGAVQAGYEYAKRNNYDYAVQIDGDGQHDPSYIKSGICILEETGADIAIGSRFINHEGFQSGGLRRLGIRYLSYLVYLCCGVKINDVTSGYRIVGKKYIERYSEDYEYDYPEPDAIVKAGIEGAKILEFPVAMRSRDSGKSSIGRIESVYYFIKVSLSIVFRSLFHRER